MKRTLSVPLALGLLCSPAVAETSAEPNLVLTIVGEPPKTTVLLHCFALTFGLDVVLEKSRGRRY